jgi:hypothetical protein
LLLWLPHQLLGALLRRCWQAAVILLLPLLHLVLLA